MKKCKKCGALQSNSRTYCLDCGALLGRPMTEAEEEAAEALFDEKLDNMADRTEDFYVPLRDKIMGILCVLGVIAAVILIYCASNATDATLGGIIAVIALIPVFPMLLFPRFVWQLSTLKYRTFYEWDTTPSESALMLRKGITYFLFGIGIIALLYGWVSYL